MGIWTFSIFSPFAFLPPPDLTWIRTEERGWFRTISWLICTVIMLILLIYNSMKWYQDLFTKERKSLHSYRMKSVASKSPNTSSPSIQNSCGSTPASSHKSDGGHSSNRSITMSTIQKKKKLPPKTGIYLFVTTSVQFSIFFYFIGTFVGFLAVWGVGCQWIFLFSLSSWEIAKGSMYIVFIVRLYTAYNESASYRYPAICLLIFGIMVGLIAFILAILSMIYAKINPFVGYKHLTKTCGAIFPPELTSSISLFDILMVFICVILFLYPLIRILMQVTNDNDGGNIMSMKRIIHLGLKYVIVSSVAAATSFISLMFITFHAETTFAAWDMAINSICIMLMLPYYPDIIFYNRLCWPCHAGCNWCCIRYNKVYSSNMNPMQRVKSAEYDKNEQTGTASKGALVASAIDDIDNNNNDNAVDLTVSTQ